MSGGQPEHVWWQPIAALAVSFSRWCFSEHWELLCFFDRVREVETAFSQIFPDEYCVGTLHATSWINVAPSIDQIYRKQLPPASSFYKQLHLWAIAFSLKTRSSRSRARSTRWSTTRRMAASGSRQRQAESSQCLAWLLYDQVMGELIVFWNRRNMEEVKIDIYIYIVINCIILHNCIIA